MTDFPILIIPDVHQDADFLKAVLEEARREQPAEIVLLGDILDGRQSFTKTTESAVRTLRLLEDLLLKPEIPTTLLWGNHDWKYWRHRELVGFCMEGLGTDGFVLTAIEDLSLRTIHALSGRTRSSLGYSRLATIWGQFAKLAVFRHGHLLSHAGIHPQFWPRGATPEEGTRILNNQINTIAMDPCFADPDGLTASGRARGGEQPHGGPLWLDWDTEFADALPFPQIVGHTADSNGARRKGNSLCLDAGQSAYALLYPDRAPVIRYLSS